MLIRADNYQDLETEFEVNGCGARQTLDFALVPGWSDIAIDSVPRGARVMVNGKSAGSTPLTIELPAGEHELVLTAERFKPWRDLVVVKANQPRKLETVQLQAADGSLTVRTNPAGANVMIGNSFAGRTPLELKLTAETQHLIHIYKAGYEKANRQVKLISEESKTLTIALKPKLGVINFVVEPHGAEIFVDGKSRGPVPRQMRLVAVEHQIEIKKMGYQSYRTGITPRPGFPQEIRITLTNPSSAKKSPAKIIKAKNGYELKLVRPSGFTMGSSRREQGRRSNETLRKVNLQRPFYIGIREVTNKEFKQFSAGHNSGKFKTYRLNRPELPVVGVTWEQAALFCNWLSAREALPPVYILKGGKLAAADPVGTGYRLPTEAEWEFCTRFNKNKVNLKYPWGNKFPPGPKSGNFADESARDLLSSYLVAYNDGYPVMAPPAKFKTNPLGLYDLGGNAAEWCHDYYSIYPYDSQKVYKDPMGPEEGKHHIIRGSSWRQSSISVLRSSYRDYSDSNGWIWGFGWRGIWNRLQESEDRGHSISDLGLRILDCKCMAHRAKRIAFESQRTDKEMFSKKLIAVLAALIFISNAPLAMGKRVDAPTTDKQLSDYSTFGAVKRESIILAQNDSSTSEDKEKTTSGSETNGSGSESESTEDDKNKSSDAKSKPLKPFVPSEKIPGDQAVDFPVDI